MPFQPEIDGPLRIYGYDGKIHLDRATPAEWRAHRIRRAREKERTRERNGSSFSDRVGRCAMCGDTDVTLEEDHIIPVSRGGCDCIQNIQPLCHPCNSKKGARG